jgi:endonuclease V
MENDKIKWEKYQLSNKKNIIKYDTFDIATIRYIGGLDISFDKHDEQNACAYLTIFDLQTNTIIYEDYKLCKMEIPYISGFLGFREIPHYKYLLNKIIGKEFYPQVIFIDGFGILHPREFGSASQLGLELDIPTVGIAKTMMCIDGLIEKQIKTNFKRKCHKKGDYIELIGNTGTIYGIAIRTSLFAFNPIYISIGHKISLNTANELVLKTCKYKNPEPIRNSDIKSKIYLK